MYLKKLFSYIVSNGLFVFLAYQGFLNGSSIAAAWYIGLNLFLIALLIFCCSIYTLVYFIPFKKNGELLNVRVAEKSDSFEITTVPKWLDLIYDYGMVAFLAYCNAWWALGLTITAYVMQAYLVDIAMRIRKKFLTEYGDSDDEDRDELIRMGVLDREN